MQKNLTLVVACLGFVVVILDVSVVNVALDQLRIDFSSDFSALEWVVNGYTLTLAAFILSTGALSDRYGAKTVLISGFVVFSSASLGCALSTDIVMLIVARFVQGLGAALVVPASLAIIIQAYPDKVERRRAISLRAAAGGMALALGPVIGGLIIYFSGWQAIFLVNVPIIMLGIFLAVRNVKKSTVRHRRRVDWFGQITAIITLGSLTGAIIEAGSLGTGSSIIWGLSLMSAVSFLSFIYVERRAADPMLLLHFFLNPTFSVSAMIGAIVNFAFYGIIFLFSLKFQDVWSYSPLATGFAFLPMTCAIICANITGAAGWWRFDERPVLLVGCLITAVGYLTLLPFVSSENYNFIALQFIVLGFGIGLIDPCVTNVALSTVDAPHAGIASSVISTLRRVGGLLGVAVIGLIAQSVTETTSLDWTIVLAGFALLVGAGLTFVMNKK